MNKKGQTIFLSLMLGIVFFWFGMVIASPMKQVIDNARANTDSTIETGLNCSTVTSYQDKANCVAIDVMLPLIVGVILGLGGFLLGRAFI